jgi:hypothetical protein
LHARARDGEPDLFNCGPGNDTAFVLRSERPRTALVGCAEVVVVEVLTADEDEVRTRTPTPRRTPSPSRQASRDTSD